MRGSARGEPEAIVDVVRSICLALPETTEQERHGPDWASHSFEIRRRSFCLLMVPDTSTDGILVFSASSDERAVFLAMGHPFFEVSRNEKKVGLVIGDAPDREEIRELVTDSYCLLAPKKLVALLHLPPD